MQTITSPILFLGAGNMAQAITSGAIQAGVLSKDRIAALDPNQSCLDHFQNGFQSPSDATDWLRSQPLSDGETPVIVLAVKPQMLLQAIEPINDAISSLPSTPLLVSILAGTTIETIRSTASGSPRIIRVMPNTPAQIRLGMSAIAPASDATELDRHLVSQLFNAVGETLEIPELLLDAFTAVAGSGPAYSFYLAEGMINAAVSMGFSQQDAAIIVRQTMLGSATLLSNSDENPETLRARVTSKNGTTHAATSTLDEHKVMDAVVAALKAARDRGIELGRE